MKTREDIRKDLEKLDLRIITFFDHESREEMDADEIEKTIREGLEPVHIIGHFEGEGKAGIVSSWISEKRDGFAYHPATKVCEFKLRIVDDDDNQQR